MNLSTLLRQRAAGGRPVRIGLIGAGKFGSMVLAQAQRIPGLHVVGVADLDVGKARASLGPRRLAGGALRRHEPRRCRQDRQDLRPRRRRRADRLR